MPVTKRNPQRLRARPDLQFIPQEGAGGDRYAVKDPVSLEYFYVRRREYFLLRELVTPRTLSQLQSGYARRFPGETVTHDELLAFCAEMHRCSLLMPEGPGQAAVIEDRADTRGGGWLGGLLSPLAVRLPGVDPTPLLRPLAGLARALFSRLASATLLVAGLLVAVLVLSQADRLVGDLARLAELWRPEHAGAALLAIVLLKSWHELGHGLAVRRFGGECHEMGVMLLALLPCLYCDASDAWSFRTRGRRGVVALAGVYFELIAATLAAAAWLVLAPGFLSHLALSVAVLGSVMTLLVNLNPLLRFDGYYLLSDAWGVANLHAESRRALWGPLTRWIGGRGPDRQPFDAPRVWLALFAVASTAQLAVVLVVILWALHRGLDAAGFRFAGDLIVAAAVFGVAVRLLIGAARTLRGNRFAPWWRPPLRMALACGVAGVAAWLALSIPLEQSLRSPCRLESAASATVAAPAAGQLVRLVAYNGHVNGGDAVARIDDPAAELALLERQAEESSLATRLAGLRTLAQRDAALFSEISVIQTRLAEVRRQRRTLERQRQRMTLTAPVAGVVTRPPPVAEDAADGLPAWTGGALDDANVGCGVEAGDLLCVVGGGPLHAVVLLREGDSGLASVGDPVRIALDRAPGEPLEGVVEDIALVAASDRRARPTDSPDLAVERALRDALDFDAAHRVRVRLGPASQAVAFAQHGAVGQARIIAGEETLAERLSRWARLAFHFR